VADHEVVEYLSLVEARPVPVTPSHAGAVIFWRDRIVPLMDFAALSGQASATTGKTVVLGYQLEPGTPLSHIAIALREAPTRLVVDDETACPLPESNAEFWNHLAKACFSQGDVSTPVIAISKLCSAEFRDFLNDYGFEPWLPENKPMSGLTTAPGGLDQSGNGVAAITAKKDTAQIIDFGQSTDKRIEDTTSDHMDDDWLNESDEDDDDTSWLDEDFDDADDLDEDDDDTWDDDLDEGEDEDEDEDEDDDSWDDDLEDFDDDDDFASEEDDEDGKAVRAKDDDLEDFDDDFDEDDDDLDEDDEEDLAPARSNKRVRAS
jgi:chemotaxis signal transduction protein